jgi:hypothetical protein
MEKVGTLSHTLSFFCRLSRAAVLLQRMNSNTPNIEESLRSCIIEYDIEYTAAAIFLLYVLLQGPLSDASAVGLRPKINPSSVPFSLSLVRPIQRDLSIWQTGVTPSGHEECRNHFVFPRDPLCFTTLPPGVSRDPFHSNRYP